MGRLTLNHFWNLRAELDDAIIEKDYDKIKEVKAKYKSWLEDDNGYSRIFTCYNTAFATDGERQKHNVLNANSILKNIEDFEKKYIEGKPVSIKMKFPYSSPFLAGEIWVLRAMYDKFLVQGKKLNQDAWKVQQNMILGQVLQDRLMALMYREQTSVYYEAIMPMFEEVKEGYTATYGKSQSKINYLQIAEDFFEK